MTKIWTWDGDIKNSFYSLAVLDNVPYHIYNEYDMQHNKWNIYFDKALPTQIKIENAYNCYQFICDKKTGFSYYKDDSLEDVVMQICNEQNSFLKPSVDPIQPDNNDWNLLHTLNEYRHATEEQKDAMYHYWAYDAEKQLEQQKQLRGGLDG